MARHSPKGRQDLWGRDPGWALRTTRGHGSCWSRGPGRDGCAWELEIPMASWKRGGTGARRPMAGGSVPRPCKKEGRK